MFHIFGSFFGFVKLPTGILMILLISPIGFQILKENWKNESM
ncbi:hypothetical protein LEP1GSC046_3469 [Leptospira kirschneri serovar Bim str. 1051]|nr:hypothetical protein LEP1GSC046_3469 [Leptospira kirschneri serovar Bim str. 1051]